MLVVPLGVIAIDFWALSSYGTRLQTLFSWTGQINPSNTVTLTDDMMTDAKADKRYLLFKDVGATSRSGTDYISSNRTWSTTRGMPTTRRPCGSSQFLDSSTSSFRSFPTFSLDFPTTTLWKTDLLTKDTRTTSLGVMRQDSMCMESEDSSYTTGEILTIDGGQSLTTDRYDDYAAYKKRDLQSSSLKQSLY